jgi:hypothetical protein
VHLDLKMMTKEKIAPDVAQHLVLQPAQLVVVCIVIVYLMIAHFVILVTTKKEVYCENNYTL